MGSRRRDACIARPSRSRGDACRSLDWLERSKRPHYRYPTGGDVGLGARVTSEMDELRVSAAHVGGLLHL